MTYLAIGLEKYFSNNFYKSPFLPQNCSTYYISNPRSLFIKVVGYIFSKKKFASSLFSLFTAFIQFEYRCRKHAFLKGSITQYFSMLLAYLYVGYLFSLKFNANSCLESKVVLIPALYTPYGLIIADFCRKYDLAFADMQHGDCNSNIFYSKQFIQKLNSFFNSPTKFYVRTKNRFSHFLDLVYYCDVEVIYEPLPRLKQLISKQDSLLVCLPYTPNEQKYLLKVLAELSLKNNSSKLVIRPHPRVLDDKNTLHLLTKYGLSIDTSSMIDFSRVCYRKYFTFQSSIIFSIPAPPQDIVVFRDVDEQRSVSVNYFESVQEASRFGCTIELPQTAYDSIARFLS